MTGEGESEAAVVGIEIGIVEDDVLARERLERTLVSSDRLSTVFAVGSVKAGIDALDAHAPRVMLVDLRLPDGDGTQILSYMRAHHPSTLAMVISALGDESSVVRAIKAGAMGYLLKDDPEPVIEQSILQLLNGGSPISPPIARHLIDYFQPAAERSKKKVARRKIAVVPRA